MTIKEHVPGVSGALPRIHGMTQGRRILATAFVVSFAFDFKGTPGGSPIQLLMGGLNAVAFLLLATNSRVTLPRKGFASFVFWGWGSFLLVGSVGAVVNATPIAHYVRIIYTFALFLGGFLVAWWTARDARGAGILISAMTTTAVLSLFFTLGWGFVFTGESIGQIRYQILSPLIPFLLVVSGYDLMLARQRRLRAIGLFSIVATLISISVTRGPLLMIIVVPGLFALAASWNTSHTARLPRQLLRAAIWGVIVVAIGLFTAALFNPNVLARWIHRSVGEAYDVTFWTRVAAIVGQFDALRVNPVGWFTGLGFGSSYPWPVSDFPWILQYLGEDAAGRVVWFPGEFMWMPFFYYGGFIFGAIAALVLVRGAFRAFRLLVNLLRQHAWRDHQLRPVWVGVLGYFAFLAMGFTANPFISRSAAMFMGLCLGLIVVRGDFTKAQIST